MARKANPEKLKFVIYARKSSEGSERQVASIPDQKEFAKKVVKENHYKVVARFEESASASKARNRPEFDKMIKLIEDGEANAIICWHTNRLARNPLESGLVQQLLFDGKIQLIH
ncbi:recombinase family protein, partial [Candidatus Saccharibacteria bacterium]|nr:recombinase family protein [Candidatus Saccharibacteria bacterium]